VQDYKKKKGIVIFIFFLPQMNDLQTLVSNYSKIMDNLDKNEDEKFELIMKSLEDQVQFESDQLPRYLFRIMNIRKT